MPFAYLISVCFIVAVVLAESYHPRRGRTSEEPTESRGSDNESSETEEPHILEDEYPADDTQFTGRRVPHIQLNLGILSSQPKSTSWNKQPATNRKDVKQKGQFETSVKRKFFHGKFAPETAYCTRDERPPPEVAHCSNPTLKDLKNARSVSANADRPNGLIPSWINIELARKGQMFADKYLPEIGMSHIWGLISSGYPDGAFFLMFTGMAGTKAKSEKRYLATLTQVLVWYQDLMFRRPSNDSDILASIAMVRSLHIAAAVAAREELKTTGRLVDPNVYEDYTLTTALAGAFFDDLNDSAIPQSQRSPPPSNWENGTIIPMNQQIAALTQFAFVGYPVLFPERLQIITATDEDIWAYNHLWAVIGYAMGIEDKYNIGLQPDLLSTRALYQQIFESFNIPNLFNMDQKTIALMEITLLGIQNMADVPVSPNFILYRFLVDLLKIEAPKTFFLLTSYDKWLMAGYKILPLIRYNAVNRESVNAAIWGGIKIAGNKKFGKNYSSRHWRARNAFYAKYA